MLSKIFASLVIFLWGTISLYMGIGGAVKTENYNIVSKLKYDDSAEVISSDGISFKSMNDKILYEENIKTLTIFPFLDQTPDFVGAIMTACFFGMLGGVILILKEIGLENIPPEKTKFISIPLLGFFTGIIVLGLSYLIPTVLVEGSTTIRPITLQFLSLFAGIYSPYFFDFLTRQVQSKLFSNEK